jgi:hypothetical protein
MPSVRASNACVNRHVLAVEAHGLPTLQELSVAKSMTIQRRPRARGVAKLVELATACAEVAGEAALRARPGGRQSG